MLGEASAPYLPTIPAPPPGSPTLYALLCITVMVVAGAWCFAPAIKSWAERIAMETAARREDKKLASTVSVKVDPCTGCEALANITSKQLDALLRHNENLYQVFHEGKGEAAAHSPLSLIKIMSGRIETVHEFITKLREEREMQETAKRVADNLREHTNPGMPIHKDLK